MSANGWCRAEEEIPIDRRDRIRLLTAALATQVGLGAVPRSSDNRSEQALDRTIVRRETAQRVKGESPQQ